MNSKILFILLTILSCTVVNAQDCEIIELAIENVSCNGSNDGKIVLDHTTSCAPPVTYSWAHGASGSSINNLSPGLYELTLTDAMGFQIEKNWLITEPDAIDIDASVSNIFCNGQEDGSISVFVNGGTFPYSYLWSTGSTNSFISDLAEGNYSVTVTDNNFCTNTASYSIEEPDPVTINVELFENISCPGENDGHIIVSGQGGTTDSGTSMVDYYYEWSSGEFNVNEIDNLSPGTYTVTVSDFYFCSAVMSFSVFDPSDIFVTFPQITDLTCNGDASGSIEINAGGGTGILTYNWSNGTTGNINDNLQAGTYGLTITDENGCTFTDSYIVNEPLAIVESPADVFDLSCFEDDTGEIEVFFSGGTGTLDYTWSNGATTSDLANLQAGQYSLTVTDDNNCAYTNIYVVNEPNEIIVTNPTIIDVDCFGNQNGIIEIFPTGGTPNYTYAWSNGETTNSIDNLNDGSYSLTITDANGCTFSATYNVFEPSEIIVTNPTIIDVDCFGNQNGIIEIFPTGGTPNYTYAWSNGETTNSIDNLNGGVYSLTITDDNGCTFTDTYNVFEPNEIIVTNPTIIDVDCFGNQNGSIEIFPTGGTPNYTYAWSNGETTNSINNLNGGSYSFTITDDNGCTFTDTYNVFEPNEIIVTNPMIIDVDCFGNQNGSIEIFPTGGTPNYTYAWSNGETTNSIDNLNGGSYPLTITDANGCTFSATYDVFEPSEIIVTNPTIIDVDCFGNQNGIIEIFPTGGTPNYTYAWSNGETTNSIDNLNGGFYSLTITDANGCTFSATYDVFEPSEIMVTNPMIIDVDCFGNQNGSIELTVEGGSPEYTYEWSNGETTSNISELPGGAYILTITDANGCTHIETFNISEPSEIIADVEIIDVECGSGDTGSITLTMSGGAGNYTFEWSNGETTNSISGLASGNYSVTVQDADNCTLAATYFVAQPGDIEIVSAEIENNTCPEDESGTINLQVTGGEGSLTFNWSNGSSTSAIQNLSSGLYSVTISDENDCNLVEEYEITGPMPLQAETLQVEPVDCFGGEDGSITFLPSGGTSPFLVEWTYMPSDGGQTVVYESIDVTGTISHLFGSGSVDIKISDMNSCLTELETILIDQPEEIIYSTPIIDDPKCNGDTSGLVSFVISGGASPYAVEWTYIPQTGGETFVKWTYNITDTVSQHFESSIVMPLIIDANGCITQVETISVNEPEPITYSNVEASSPVCANDTSGIASFQITGGTSPYSVEWTYIPQGGQETCIKWTYNVTDVASNNFPSGIVTPKVIDANGCEIEVEVITISEPTAFDFSALSTNDALCYGDTTGQVSFEIKGGLAPFIVEWTYTPLGSSIEIVDVDINTSGIVNRLFAAGKVEIQVKDDNACHFEIPSQNIGVKNEIKVEQLDIEQPKCGEDSSGVVSILLSGGASPYAIEWTYIPAEGSETFVEWTYNITGIEQFNFGPGIISANIIDAEGCSLQLEEMLLNNLEGAEINEIKVTYTDGLGNIELIMDTPVSDLTFTWSGPNGFTSTDQNITKLEAGSYSCIITDSNGCQTLTGDVDIVITSLKEINTSDLITVNTLSTETLSIQSKADHSCQMICLDLNGRQILSQRIHTGDNTIDVSQMPSGLYVIMLKVGKDTYSQLISKF